MEGVLSRGVESTLLIKMSLFIIQIRVVSIEKVEKTGVFEVTFCDSRPRRARIDHVCIIYGSPSIYARVLYAQTFTLVTICAIIPNGFLFVVYFVFCHKYPHAKYPCF